MTGSAWARRARYCAKSKTAMPLTMLHVDLPDAEQRSSCWYTRQYQALEQSCMV